MKQIILINGKKRSGKNFVADELKKNLLLHGYTSEILSFAYPMKEMASILFGISLSDLDTYKNNPDEYGYAIQAYPSNQPHCNIQYGDFRTILQRLGTEATKPWFGEDVWVSLLQKKAKTLDVDFIIVPDFRFLIENISDFTIYVKNTNCGSIDSHRSETELEQANFCFKYTIDNSKQEDITDVINDIISKEIDENVHR